MKNGHHLAAGGLSLHHHAQQVALVTDHGIVDGHAIQCAAVQCEAIEGIQRVTANDKAGKIAHLWPLALDAFQCLVGLVLGLDAVVIHYLLAQLGVFGLERLVLSHHVIDAGVLFPQGGHAAADHSSHFLEWSSRHAQQLLRSGSQAAVGTGVGHDAHQKHRDAHQDLEFPGIEKVFQGVFLRLQKGADSPEPSAPSVTSLHMSSIGVQHVVQNIHMIQHRTGTLGHAIQRVLRNMDINACLALD